MILIVEHVPIYFKPKAEVDVESFRYDFDIYTFINKDRDSESLIIS